MLSNKAIENIRLALIVASNHTPDKDVKEEYLKTLSEFDQYICDIEDLRD